MFLWPAVLLLSFVTLQRLSELLIARRNTAALLAKGGVEIGAAHYPVMVLLHASWLAGLWYWGRNAEVQLLPLTIYVLLQVFRFWILRTLGRRWTTRIITIPNEVLVAAGPFKYMRHPNYALVALEVPILPLALGLYGFAALYCMFNLAMLAWRISVEEQALKALR